MIFMTRSKKSGLLNNFAVYFIYTDISPFEVLREVDMDFIDKMKGYVDKGVSVSKEAFGKAGGAVQNFSDKSVVRIEIKQLETKRKVQLDSLGEKVYALFGKGKCTEISADMPDISPLLADLKKIDRDISKRKKALEDEKPDSGEKKK